MAKRGRSKPIPAKWKAAPKGIENQADYSPDSRRAYEYGQGDEPAPAWISCNAYLSRCFSAGRKAANKASDAIAHPSLVEALRAVGMAPTPENIALAKKQSLYSANKRAY